MQQLKIISSKTDIQEKVVLGQVCSLPGKDGIDSAKGAMGSAIATIIL